MAFVSTKLVQDIRTAIANAQSGDKVTEAELQFKRLRQRYDYQIGLTTFIASAKNINDRLLAIIELQKMQVILQEQSARVLSSHYYSAVEKEASMIRKLFTNMENLKWTCLFLEVDFDKIGYGEAIAYMEFIYSILKDDIKSRHVLEGCGQILEKGLLELVEVIIESQDGLLMLMVLVSMFYDAVISLFSPELLGRLKQHWRLFSQKCKFYQSSLISGLKQSIQAMFTSHKGEFSASNLYQLVTLILKESNRNNQLSVRYTAYYLKFVCKHSIIFHSSEPILSFIRALNDYAYQQNQNTLREVQFKGTTILADIFQCDQENKQQQLISSHFRRLTESIFEQHYRTIAQEYSQTEGNRKPLFLYLLPLVNHYNSLEHPLISEWVKNHISNITNHIGSYLSHLSLQSQRSKDFTNDFISCLELLVKYKNLIDIGMLPHICNILQDISTANSVVSPLCYLFMEEVWEQLTCLDFNQLTSFLLKHLQKLNNNQWDHELSHYTCFLHLVEHLEETYRFCSNFMTNDELFQESIKAQKIMVTLLEQNRQKQFELEVVSKLILLTSYLIGENTNQNHWKTNLFGINTLINYIKRFELEGPQHMKILQFGRAVEENGQLGEIRYRSIGKQLEERQNVKQGYFLY